MLLELGRFVVCVVVNTCDIAVSAFTNQLQHWNGLQGFKRAVALRMISLCTSEYSLNDTDPLMRYSYDDFS